MRKHYYPHYDESKEYENNINAIRVEKGLTLREVAEAIGTTASHVWFISQGYTGPFATKSGKLKRWAKRLQEFFGYDLSEIFPREVCSLDSTYLTDDQICEMAHGHHYSYSDPESVIFETSRLLNVFEIIAEKLTIKQRRVLYMMYILDMTRAEVAELLGVSDTLVMFTEMKSLRLIRQAYARRVSHAKTMMIMRSKN